VSWYATAINAAFWNRFATLKLRKLPRTWQWPRNCNIMQHDWVLEATAANIVAPRLGIQERSAVLNLSLSRLTSRTKTTMLRRYEKIR